MADDKGKVKIVATGRPMETRIIAIRPDGTEFDISRFVRAVKWEHRAGLLPVATVELILTDAELVMEVKDFLHIKGDFMPAILSLDIDQTSLGDSWRKPAPTEGDRQ